MNQSIIKAIVVEDEPSAAAYLKTLLREHHPQVKIIAEAVSVQEALERIQMLQPDLVFLDVELADGNIFEALDQLSNFSGDIIFTTGHDEFAVRAFRYNAIDFLLKPIDPDLLAEAIAKILQRQNLQKPPFRHLVQSLKTNIFDKIILSVREEFHVVQLSDITHLTGEGNYTSVFLKNEQRIVVSRPLKYYEDLLPETMFIRVHQSHIVNFSGVKRVLKGDESNIELENGELIPLARRKREVFLEELRGRI